MILPGTKVVKDLVTDFCSEKALGKPPAKITVYDWDQYSKVTGMEKPSCYSPTKDELALSPDIQSALPLILHELAHHFQALRDGAEEFDRKYDRYLETHGYENNPYEIEAREFARKWWPNFERLLKERLEEK